MKRSALLKFLSIFCAVVIGFGAVPTVYGASPTTLEETNSLSDMLTTIDEDVLDTDSNTDGASGLDNNKDDGSSNAAAKPTSSKVTYPTPVFDVAVQSGKKVRLQCSAPSGSKVSVTINGKNYNLKEKSKSSGIGKFAGDYKLPTSTGVKSLGNITYSATINGTKHSATSEGKLFAVGTGATLTVQVKNPSATCFNDPRVRTSGFVTTLKKGAVDTVTSYYKNMYRLSSVGWVDASAVTPLTKSVSASNTVSSVSFSKTNKGESFILNGTSHPTYTASHTSDSLTLKFSKTSGVPSIDTSSSSLVSTASVSSSGGSTTIKFTLNEPNSLWGYLVGYNGGKTTILLRSKPSLGSDDAPLSGLVVAVDAGHGGTDVGAQGLGAGNKGPVEKTINLSTANILKAKLEAKGATVVMLRPSDTKVTLNDRISAAEKNNVDFVISLHCNSSSNASAAGVEVYYYEAIAKSLASTISANLSSDTSRNNRGSKYNCYVITLNSFAPSVLVEMGFMTNQAEYDNLKNEEVIETASDSIVKSIIQELGK